MKPRMDPFGRQRDILMLLEESKGGLDVGVLNAVMVPCGYGGEGNPFKTRLAINQTLIRQPMRRHGKWGRPSKGWMKLRVTPAADRKHN